MRRVLLPAVTALMLAASAAASAADVETVVEIGSRGQAVRALLIEPASGD